MHDASARRPCRLSQRRLPRTAETSSFSTATYIRETFHAQRKRPKATPPFTAPSPSNGRSIRVQHGGNPMRARRRSRPSTKHRPFSAGQCAMRDEPGICVWLQREYRSEAVVFRPSALITVRAPQISVPPPNPVHSLQGSKLRPCLTKKALAALYDKSSNACEFPFKARRADRGDWFFPSAAGWFARGCHRSLSRNSFVAHVNAEYTSSRKYANGPPPFGKAQRRAASPECKIATAACFLESGRFSCRARFICVFDFPRQIGSMAGGKRRWNI